MTLVIDLIMFSLEGYTKYLHYYTTLNFCKDLEDKPFDEKDSSFYYSFAIKRVWEKVVSVIA